MAIIKCKMCGGDITLAEGKTFGTCEYCGSVMTLPKVSDEQRAAAFNRGNHFRRVGEFDKALAVYERIVAEDDTDAEAHWCCALCRFGIEYVEDPATYEWLPTCHRASFDSFLEDVDYLAALEHSDGITRRQYQKDAAKIAEVQKGILATSQSTEPYDVFISYKELDADGNRTRDSILAQEIYYRLTEKGWRVFFSRISLEDVPGTQYEPYIFAALNSAKVMIVVGTSAENLNAVWVKNEWSRYLSLMRRDRTKLLIPCYRDMDPYDLPEQLSVLMSYDMGRIGFIQDLIRGVDKVLSAEKPKEVPPAPAPVQERVIVQQSAGGPNVTALLKRGQQALEDGDWDRASGFFDQVLSMDAENAEAFLGLALAGNRSRDTAAFIDSLCNETPKTETHTIKRDTEHIRKSIDALTVPHYCEAKDLAKLYDVDVSYPVSINGQKAAAEKSRARFNSDRNLNRAFRYAQDEAEQKTDKLKSDFNGRLEKQLRAAETADLQALESARAEYAAKLEAADRKAQGMSRAASERREADYRAACARQDAAETEDAYREAAEAFQGGLKGYKDCDERAEQCRERAERLRRAAAEKAAAEEAERKRIAAEKAERERIERERAAAAARKKKNTITAVAVILAIAAIAGALLYTKVLVPKQKYDRAMELLSSGNYDEAYVLLGEIGDSETIKQSKHDRAMELLSSGKYDEAYVLLGEIGESETINQSKYDRAEKMISSGDYEGAYQLFSSVDYQDSAERAHKLLQEHWGEVYQNAAPGDVVVFGSYEQDNNTANGAEAIEWQVLARENDRLLVISKYALDCQPYSTKYEDVTWESCSLRGWLNESFLKSAFSSGEQAMIPTVTVSADKNPSYGTDPGKDTKDKVFLLSMKEADNYFSSGEARKCKPTAFAKANGCYVNDSTGTCWWWLRSPGSSADCAAFVVSGGSFYAYGDVVVSVENAVRPALWIHLVS